MSEFIHTGCACGGDIVSISPDEDDVRIAVASHNETMRHVEWRAVQEAKRPRKRGPCICKGGVTNPPQTPPTGEVRAPDRRVPGRCVVGALSLTPHVK